MVNTIANQAKPLSGDELTSADTHIKSTADHRHSSYSCHLCTLKFKKKDSLDRHIFHHTGEKAYACDFSGCDKKYSNKSHLNRHKKASHTEQDAAMIACAALDCHQFFTNQSNANRHYQQQHSERFPNVCTDCGQSFRRKIQLKRHTIAVHTGDFPNSCKLCGKGFLNVKSMLRHIRRNHKKKCEICGEKFENWSQLVKHRNVHRSDQKSKFTCDCCDKTFSRKPNIKEHMKIHTMRDTVFMCHYENCPKFYTALRNLNAHIRAKHEGKAGWTCDECGQQLSTKQRLVQHLQAHLDPERRKLLQKRKRIAFMKLIPMEVEIN